MGHREETSVIGAAVPPLHSLPFVQEVGEKAGTGRGGWRQHDPLVPRQSGADLIGIV